MRRISHLKKTLGALLVLALCYLVYDHLQFTEKLLSVYDVDDRYAYGPDDADLTIVDFNNFTCGDCQNLHPLLKQAIELDGNVRYVPRLVSDGKEWGKTLVVSVYAAAEQGKFFELHSAIYKNWPVETSEDLFEIAKSIGLDTERLSRDMSSAEIKARAGQDDQYFIAWRSNRTPTLLMGGGLIYRPQPQDFSVEILREGFERARLAQ